MLSPSAPQDLANPEESAPKPKEGKRKKIPTRRQCDGVTRLSTGPDCHSPDIFRLINAVRDSPLVGREIAFMDYGLM